MFFDKTLVVLTSGGDQSLFDRKILGLTSAQWVINSLAPYFKETKTAESEFCAEDCFFVGWDRPLIRGHDLRQGNLCPRLETKNFSWAEQVLQARILDGFCANGVILHGRQGITADATVKIERGAEIFAPNAIKGSTHIGEGTIIYPYCFLQDAAIGKNCSIKSTFAQSCVVGNRCEVGPFAYLRPNAVIDDGCRVGDFVEIKNSVLGKGVKCAHLTYVGDAEVGCGTNIGCGTVFANFDGKTKHKTVVGKNCFVGSNVNLIAPVTLEDGVFVAAGTTVTRSAPQNAFVIGRARAENKTKKEKIAEDPTRPDK